jgi:cyanophycinase-like exopeptidase
MEAIGSGLVILVDGRDIKDTNITQVQLGQPISINNLVVHVMSMNDTILGLIKCKFIIHKTEHKLVFLKLTV